MYSTSYSIHFSPGLSKGVVVCGTVVLVIVVVKVVDTVVVVVVFVLMVGSVTKY